MFDRLKLKNLTAFLVIGALWVLTIVAALRVFDGNLANLNIGNGKLSQTQRLVEEESVVIDVVEKASPSVVSIAIENRQLFTPFGARGEKESGIGTGFVISSDGLILTNQHVVSLENEKYIVIVTNEKGDERKLEVKEIHKDPFNDLAIIKVDANDLAPIELGDSDQIKVGQKVIAIGNALGMLQNTVTTGVVSGLGRGVSPVDPTTGIAERLEDLVQTDAAINPGNSGGPLVNSAGQVIAINTAVASGENIGFAIKINIAKQLIEDFNRSGGRISRPLLGIRYTHVSRDVAILNEVPEGELVQEVVSGSAAADAGIRVGDIITHFDGQRLSEETRLAQIIRGKKVGESVSIRVFRDGQTIDLTATLKEASQ
ncbi:MAG: trypsin-like peptidase domain-containing protein [Candidatus Curtissbacteria bacterium]|nr:trypsin-like peptidase domain-containing protein [Candidatus Curtissbacteria bacterium]